MTLAIGGVLATLGSRIWVYLLSAPEPASATRCSIALLTVCHGCRFQYFGSVCGILNAFPPRYSATLSSCLAALVSVGYIVTPYLWKTCFLPDKRDMSMMTTDGMLKSLQLVAGFWKMLCCIYLVVTIFCLSVARCIPKKAGGAAPQLSVREKLALIKEPEAFTLVLFVAMWH